MINLLILKLKYYCVVTETVESSATASLPSTSTAVHLPTAIAECVTAAVPPQPASLPSTSADEQPLASTEWVTAAAPSGRGKRPRSVEQQLIELQQQTLSSVQQLVCIQQQLLEIKRAKLELRRETVEMRKAEMLKNGMVQTEDGSWVILCQNSEE